MSVGYFECKYCSKKFTSENNFNKHMCTEKERFLLVTKDIRGRRAFLYYKRWQNLKKRHVEVDTFITSRYFNTFISFVEFIDEKSLPTPDVYIKFCDDKGLLPAFWKRSDLYLMYMQAYDSLVDPLEQSVYTISVIKKMAGIIGCEPHEVFKYLYGGEVLQLLSKRQLSPYLLVLSKKFSEFMKTLLYEESLLIRSTYDPENINSILENAPEIRENIIQLIKAHGL